MSKLIPERLIERERERLSREVAQLNDTTDLSLLIASTRRSLRKQTNTALLERSLSLIFDGFHFFPLSQHTHSYPLFLSLSLPLSFHPLHFTLINPNHSTWPCKQIIRHCVGKRYKSLTQRFQRLVKFP